MSPDNAPDNRGDALDVFHAHIWLAGELDEITPDVLCVTELLSRPMSISRKKVDRHIAALDLIAGAAQDVEHTRGSIIGGIFRPYTDHLS
jgi:hypothetical protein